MVIRDEVQHDRRLPDSIIITVTEVNTQPKYPRDLELTATDENGSELYVIVWKTHDIDQQWVESQDYELDGARGKRYSTQSGTRVELHSTSAFRVQEVNQSDTTRLLVMGDTHVGYRHRPQSDKSSWAQNVNGRDVFTRCLKRAREADVDAVVHAGDIFDHHNTEEDRLRVGQAINRTVQFGIPFYYVYGNHDDEYGRRLLNTAPGVHLTEDTTLVGEQPVNLLGVDHLGHRFPTQAPKASIELLLNQNILVVHETPYPVVDDGGKIVYQNDGNKADISGFIETAHYGIDLVITGHLHVAKQPQVQDYDIPVLVTGPTIPISSYLEDNRPSTWLLTITNEGPELNRQPL